MNDIKRIEQLHDEIGVKLEKVDLDELDILRWQLVCAADTQKNGVEYVKVD